MRAPFRAFLAGLAVAVTFATNCASAGSLSVLNRGNGAEPKSLDPHFIDLIPEAQIVGDLLIGLTTLDAAGRPIPGAATSWETSADGKTWTFHLRPHRWSDGTWVTAHDFVFAWQRLLDPKTAAAYAYNLWLVKNAVGVNSGKLPPSALAVSAPDDRTLVVALEHPAAYLPELLTHETAYPVPRSDVLKFGNDWAKPERYVGNGPYVPKEWVPNDHITLVRNPLFYDAANVRIDVINYYPTQNTEAALTRFRANELDTQSPIPLEQINWIRKSFGPELRSVPFLGLSYVDINIHRPPFNDVRLREALNLAYDREVMTEKVLRFGDKPAYSIVPPGVANFPCCAEMDFAKMPYADRLKKAQWLMAQMGYGPDNHFQTTYETTGEPDSRRIAAVLQFMLRKIYVDTDILAVDENVHYRNMQRGDYDLGSASWLADFSDASNFLDLLRKDSGNNNGKYDNPNFDRALDAAQAEPDAVKRGQLLLAAEKIALKDYPWIPTRYRMTQDLVHTYVKGWVENDRGYNPSRFLWLKGKPGGP